MRVQDVLYDCRGMRGRSDRIFLWLVSAALLPAGAMAFALTRGAHDARVALAKAPAPVADVCQIVVTYSINPISHALYVTFAAVAVLSLSLGLFEVVSLHLRTQRRLSAELESEGAYLPRLRRLAASVGLAPPRILAASEPRAFTFGYLSPSVAVSRGLLSRLNDEELEAVLRHEAEHVRRRDPLRMLVVAGLTKALIIAPIVRRIGHAFQVAKEVDADVAVLRAMGPRPLVSALLSAAPSDTLDAAPGFADTLDARIAWLEGEDPLSRGPHGLASWILTAGSLIVVAVGLFVTVTGAVDAHVLHVCIDG